MINIRPADKNSAAELSELCRTSFAEAYKGVNSEEDIKAYCEKNYSQQTIETNLSNPGVIYEVAYKGGKAVGFFMVQTQDCPIALDGDAVELKQIYVLSSEFGTGLGKQLLDEVFRCARQLNKKWIWLSVSDLNTRAQSFYRKHGFQPLGAAPTLEVGNDRLIATVMTIEVC